MRSRPIKICILVCTLNEENHIGDRLINLMSLILPENILVSIHVIDNGSTDRTCDIVSDIGIASIFPTVLHKLSKVGKCGALFWAFKNLECDIFLLTDANTIFSSNTLIELNRCIAKPGKFSVCVGNFRTVRNVEHLLSIVSVKSFNYSLRMRIERLLGVFTGANGAFYAVTRQSVHGIWRYPPIRNDDFIISVYASALAPVRYISNAYAYEIEDFSLRHIYRQKYRDALGHHQAIWWIMRFIKRKSYSIIVVSLRLAYWFGPMLVLYFSIHLFSTISIVSTIILLQIFASIRRLTLRWVALIVGYIVGLIKSPPVSWTSIR